MTLPSDNIVADAPPPPTGPAPRPQEPSTSGGIPDEARNAEPPAPPPPNAAPRPSPAPGAGTAPPGVQPATPDPAAAKHASPEPSRVSPASPTEDPLAQLHADMARKFKANSDAKKSAAPSSSSAERPKITVPANPYPLPSDRYRGWGIDVGACLKELDGKSLAQAQCLLRLRGELARQYHLGENDAMAILDYYMARQPTERLGHEALAQSERLMVRILERLHWRMESYLREDGQKDFGSLHVDYPDGSREGMDRAGREEERRMDNKPLLQRDMPEEFITLTNEIDLWTERLLKLRERRAKLEALKAKAVHLDNVNERGRAALSGREAAPARVARADRPVRGMCPEPPPAGDHAPPESRNPSVPDAGEDVEQPGPIAEITLPPDFKQQVEHVQQVLLRNYNRQHGIADDAENSNASSKKESA